MEWNEKLQMIIDYVENHLQQKQEPMDAQEISKIAGCSFGFFQKVFSYMVGISFSDYVRYRKLTLAGYDLKSTDKKVVDISYQYGYNSPTSFTKAFQLFHGVGPSEARSKNMKLRVVPKLQILEKQPYLWSLEQKRSFRLIGKGIQASRFDGDLHTRILEFWSDCQRNGLLSTLFFMSANDPKGIFGIFLNDEEDSSKIQYAIMAATDGELPEGFSEIIIPEATWAIFDCRGPVPQAIQNGWNYLQEEWLIKYPFQHGTCPELEWYSSGNSFADDYLSQIWIPVIDQRQ